jgi:HEAT repeat protein
MLFNTLAVASTTGPAVGRDNYRRDSLKPDRYIADLADAIPRLEFYHSWGLKTRCYWSAEAALQDFKDWFAQLHSADAKTRKQSLLASGRFNASDFCDEAREAIVEQSRSPLLAALADSDPQSRRGAADILRSLDIVGDDVLAVLALNSDSDDPGVRETALDQAIWMTCDPDKIVETICLGLSDSAVSVRKRACTAIQTYRNRLSVRNAKKIVDLIREKLKVVDDVELLTTLVQCFPSASSIKELCHIIENTSDAPLRSLTILQLGKIGEDDPKAMRAILAKFDEFPLQASEAIIDMKCYSSKAKSKMSELLTANDWSLRWRGVLYLENCPRLSRPMRKSLEERLKDKEFTVRDAAQRVLKKLER